jgi:hypothetical protein
MKFRAGFTLALAAGLAVASAGGWLGCEFTPAGGGGGSDGGGEDDAAAGDASGATDAAVDLDASTATVDARPPCPAAYSLVQGGSRYVRRSTGDTIDGARSDCADDLAGRTMLATFESPADLDPVLGASGAPGSEQLWVGTRCEPGGGCAFESWTWDTGVALDPTLWATGEPGGRLFETSAVTLKAGPIWKLASAGTLPNETHPYVCECVE